MLRASVCVCVGGGGGGARARKYVCMRENAKKKGEHSRILIV